MAKSPEWVAIQRKFRPRSKYSISSEFTVALNDLLKNVASRGATAILTFPDYDCSNGLSGNSVREIAAEHFNVCLLRVASKFSTLGGTGDDRGDEGLGVQHERMHKN